MADDIYLFRSTCPYSPESRRPLIMGAKKGLGLNDHGGKPGRVLIDWGNGEDVNIRLGRDERVTILLLPRPGTPVKRITVELTGNGSSLEILGLVIGSRDEQYRIEVNVRHTGLSTTAYAAIRGVLFDASQLSLKGLIRIEEGADQTTALLENRVLLIGKKARAVSVPSLEIKADEVRASHATAIGQVDEQSVFYLQSRGIGREKAMEMLSEGFFEPILSRLNDPRMIKEVRQYLWQNLLKR